VYQLTGCICNFYAFTAGNGSVRETQEEETADGTDDNAEDGEVWQDNFRLEYVLQPPPASRPDLRGTSSWLACAGDIWRKVTASCCRSWTLGCTERQQLRN
jgi:hypothetical protein